MLTINNYVTPSPEQWEIIIHGMRNPMNSWDKSDSLIVNGRFLIGMADLDLMHRLSRAGSDHRKFMRMIPVYITITAPLYWWKEFDTYKIGTVANSCSTMHKLHARPLTLDDFSCENLNLDSIEILTRIIKGLNEYRSDYLFCHDKSDWWQLIQLLPSSYNQQRTVFLNYETLHNIYHSRRDHKLTEWHTLCDFIRGLPYAEIITGEAT